MTPVQLVQERTLGLGWLEVSRRILEHGLDETYDGAATKELALVTLAVGEPDPEDELIASLADPDWLAWMKRNFTEPDDVPELGNARSYAKRLRDYDGRDQVAWVIGRLRTDPETRSATITTFQPLADTSYIPCVSLLDFWRSGGAPRAGRLRALARLRQEGVREPRRARAPAARVATAVALPVGPLVIHAKSAHVYEPELETMRRLTQIAV